MKPLTRRILAIIGLILMVPFIVFLIMALGFTTVMNGLDVPLAGVFGCLVVIIFLLLKMDEVRKRRIEERTQAAKDTLAEGAEALNTELSDEASSDRDEIDAGEVSSVDTEKADGNKVESLSTETNDFCTASEPQSKQADLPSDADQK